MNTTPGEHDSTERRPRGSLSAWLAVGVMLLPVFYFLLSGPAVWLSQRGVGRELLATIYKPMIWLEQSDTPIGRLLMWYWSLWK